MKKNLLMRAAQVLTALLLLGSTAAFAGTKVEVCHVPQGNQGNFHTIKVSENALSAHLGHGDIAGPCDAACATLCDDGNACTIDDTGDCELNGCPVTPEAVDCNDGNSCTLDSCDVIAGCLNDPQENMSCDDGQVCSGPDVCSAEGICGGPAVDNCCVSDAQCSQNFCDQESCNMDTNTCGGVQVMCSAQDLCQVSVCSNLDGGGCVTTPVSCADGESCNPDTGACEPPTSTGAGCPCLGASPGVPSTPEELFAEAEDFLLTAPPPYSSTNCSIDPSFSTYTAIGTIGVPTPAFQIFRREIFGLKCTIRRTDPTGSVYNTSLTLTPTEAEECESLVRAIIDRDPLGICN